MFITHITKRVNNNNKNLTMVFLTMREMRQNFIRVNRFPDVFKGIKI